MKLPPGVLEEGILKIDWTGFSRVLECDRKAWHELAWRRRPAGFNSSLFFGEAIHAALDLRQRWLMKKPKLSDTEMDDLRQGIDRLLEQHYQNMELAEDEHRTLGRAKEVAALYLAEYPSEPFEIVASEQVGERELGEVLWYEERAGIHQPIEHVCRVIWQGKADGLWLDPRNGKLSVKDTKTTSYYDRERDLARYKMSGQLKGYCALFSTPEQPINQAIVDTIIVRPPLKRQSSASLPRTEFVRDVFEFPPAVIEEWRRDTLKRIGQWLTNCGHFEEPPPMNTESCTRFRVCPFLQCCEQADEESRLRWLLGGHYEENEWNVMDSADRTT